MQAKNQIRPFTCNIHPSEVIERVYLDINAETSLRCTECILSEKNKVSKDVMLTLNDFIENAVKQYETSRRVPLLHSQAPDEFVSFLAQEDEKIQRLSQHIEQENERVNATLNLMIQEFTVLCHAKKEEMARLLDKQVLTLKHNYTYYKSKIDKSYSKDQKNELNPDRETLIDRINQCEDTNQMEMFVKNLKYDLLEASRDHNPDLEINKIRLLAQELQQQADFVPKSLFCDQPMIEESLKKFKEVTEKLMEVKVENQITELSFKNFVTIDSKLIKNEEDLNLLRQWLVPENQYCRLNLLYRGSRDGMTVDAFHKKCDDHAETLTIAKSSNGRVFGGYSEQTWNVTNCFKGSDNAWIFSLDEKRKYPIKSEKNAYSIATYQGSGPIFGSGPDLHISLASSQTNLAESAFRLAFKKSYSALGGTYELSFTQIERDAYLQTGRNNIHAILAGICQFDTQEIEVFSVQAISQKSLEEHKML